MLRLITILLLTLTAAGRLHAIEGAAYLKASEGVRSTGLAGAYSMFTGSPESLWYNPAGLVGLRGVQGSFIHQAWEKGIDSDHIVLAAPWGWQHALGLLYNRRGVFDVYRDDQGVETGRFEVSDSVLGLGYAFDFGSFALGASVKMLSEVIDTASASATAFDFGAATDFYDDHILLGLSVQNLGSVPVLGDVAAVDLEVRAPLLLRAGLGLSNNSPTNRFTASAELRNSFESARTTLAFGAEYSEQYDIVSLALRGGWDQGLSEIGGLAGLSAGLSIGYDMFALNYAWTALDALGSAHRLSLSFVWDLKKRANEQSLKDFLQSPGEGFEPTPTPVVVVLKPTPRSRNDIDLDAILRTTPTPTLTPDRLDGVVEDKPVSRGILGALASWFGFGKKTEPTALEAETGGEGAQKEAVEEKKTDGTLLKGIWGLFGLNKAEEVKLDEPAGTQAAEEELDRPAEPQPTATPQPGFWKRLIRPK